MRGCFSCSTQAPHSAFSCGGPPVHPPSCVSFLPSFPSFASFRPSALSFFPSFFLPFLSFPSFLHPCPFSLISGPSGWAKAIRALCKFQLAFLTASGFRRRLNFCGHHSRQLPPGHFRSGTVTKRKMICHAQATSFRSDTGVRSGATAAGL